MVLLLLAAALAASDVRGAEPYLVRDINQVPTPADSFPGDFGVFGDVAVFAASDDDGRELWRSDGTEAGTYRLLDACPGPCSSSPTHLASTPLGSFFAVTSGDFIYRELWVTRGNPGDTVKIASRVGAGSLWKAWVPELGKLFFVALDEEAGLELWVTDGTPAGTRVLDVSPGPSSSNPTWPVAFQGRVFFLAYGATSVSALWTSDGTPGGTRLVKETSPGSQGAATSGVPSGLRVVGKRLVFFAATPGKGLELWKSDGTTAGTTLLAELARGPASSTLLAITVGSGRAFVVVSTPKAGQELWVTDGTGKGTRQLTFFQPAEAFAQPGELLGLFGGFAGGRFVFHADDGAHGREAWVSDGTVKGTRLLADVCPGSCHGGMVAVGPVGSQLIFTAYESERGAEPWITDGARAGTRLLADICAGSCSSIPRGVGTLGGRLLFVTHGVDGYARLRITDGSAGGLVDLGVTLHAPARGLQYVIGANRAFFAGTDVENGSEPWTTDGSLAGTRLARDVDDVELSHSRPGFFHAAGDRLYFFAADGTSGFEPWLSDGTAAGTRRIADIGPDEHPGNPPSNEMAAVLGGTLLFTRYGDEVHELWRTDGSAAGTFRVTAEPMWTRELATAGNLGFFTAVHEDGLWRTDGTVAGTARVVDDPARMEGLTGWNGTLFFSADGELGDELWKSDGTAAGTALVKDILPGSDSSSPSAFAAGPAGLYFLARGVYGSELWRTDGTGAGTQRIAELVGSGFDGGLRTKIVPLGALTFVFTGGGVWVTDGTEAGTRRIAAVVGPVDPDRTPPVAFGGAVYFAGPGPLSALILWRSDGSEAGTFPLLDAAGETLEWPASLRVFAGRLAFAASQGDSFLWTSDGTSAGTRRVFPLMTVWGGSVDLAVAGSRLYFSPATREHGQELWALPAD